jgi:aminoglycoside phosphotransferase (APT) family kinase protein
MAHGSPSSEVAISEPLLRDLLRTQHPDLADLPLALFDCGWDNETWRLGDALAMRLPRRAISEQLLRNEQIWLPHLAPSLPIAIPEPVRFGVPSASYPWVWSIVPWIIGNTVNHEAVKPSQAHRFADFLRRLHGIAPENAPTNSARDGNLAGRASEFEPRVARLGDRVSATNRRAWQAGLDVPHAAKPSIIHGDLHPRNILAKDGALTGIIDWGDICAGDPAVDLSGAWGLFAEASARKAVLDHYGADEAMRVRAMARALYIGVVLLDSGLVDRPEHAAIGQTILDRVEADMNSDA